MSRSVTEQQLRTGFRGNLVGILPHVCSMYGIGDYRSYHVIPFGYEDCNLRVETSTGSYLVKIFSVSRDTTDRTRYLRVMEVVSQRGVRHPHLYTVDEQLVSTVYVDKFPLCLCVMDYITEGSFYEVLLRSGARPTLNDARSFSAEAAKINSLGFKIAPVTDTWAITNFAQRYAHDGHVLGPDDEALVGPLVPLVERALQDLPFAFIHGDLNMTNWCRAADGGVYVIDFSVARRAPRIMELAVLLGNCLFDANNPTTFPAYYAAVLDEYQRTIRLTPRELEVLPVLIQATFAMYLIGGALEVLSKGGKASQLDQYYIDMGRNGLRYMRTFIPPALLHTSAKVVTPGALRGDRGMA